MIQHSSTVLIITQADGKKTFVSNYLQSECLQMPHVPLGGNNFIQVSSGGLQPPYGPLCLPVCEQGTL